MTDCDPFATRHVAAGSVAAELVAYGFEDATEIGRGGFGVVYRCTQPSLDRVVAVKVLTADLDEENRARFFREQRAAGRLTGHPHVVNVFQSGVTGNGRPFMVMPYYAQDPLDTRIRERGPLPLADALRLGVKIAGALESAHRLGILHRDVKPGNILITDYGEPALSDFGIAHFAGGFETGTGVVTGSPAFLAPEIVTGETPSPASDVYGLGATLFAAITGHAVFERRSGEQLMAQFLRITSPLVPIPRAFGVDDDVGTIIDGAMSGDSSARPTAVELGQQLRDCQLRHGLRADAMALNFIPAQRKTDTPAPSDRAQRGTRRQREVSNPAESDRTGGLPLELTSFVDRRTELAAARNLLTSARLVTLTGIGGVGKTRLALRIAVKAQRNYSSGAHLVKLAELREATLLTGVVAGALGIQDRSTKPIREMLTEFLAQRELLLVLDNCEQIVGAVAQLAEYLLRTCPDLRILATSREAIGIGGEVILLVPPLPVPDPDHLPRVAPSNDSIQLFVDRGSRVVPGFEFTENNKVAIASICRQLDGHPLSIELAAARLRAMSPEQILVRLTERYALLTHGSRDAPSRQQTLQMCIDWSYDLCTPMERAVWAQLSVFSGGFGLAAAEQVCDADLTPTELLDAVTILVEKSILTREDSGATVRFLMLETIRDYGQQRAREAGEHEYAALRRRHLHWCASMALTADAEWISPRQIEWITTLAGEQSNLREALEFCVSDSPETGAQIAGALVSFWICQGAITEGRQWLGRFRADRPGPPTIADARAVYAGCLLAALQGDLTESASLAEQGRTLADRTTEPLVRVYLEQAAGDCALFNGDFPAARVHLGNVVHHFAEREIRHAEVMTLLSLGLALGLLNEDSRAIEWYERALMITETHEETMYRSYVQWALAISKWRQGDRERAAQLLKQALLLGRKIDDRLNAGMCLPVLAWIAAENKDIRRAAVLLGAAEAANRSVGSSPVVVPGFMVHQDEYEHQVRKSLGEKAFSEAHRKGAALGFHDAVDFALGEQRTPPRNSSTGPSTRPTKRELEVADLIADGLTNKEIAARLVISPRTAQGHVEHLLVKLGFTSRTQIAAWVVEARNEYFGN
ncbi:protein kinase domain-containing protein [Rhodococcus globerulus]|uniref:protein kinase domain-containing protein n=1 Tax=Rhodococcus globerulus TaxID=33008 RepID=UPI0030197F8D